tara:strand:- start:625 stop:903 length:279 start_codon:yes stop_codon:yes gene_type:complete
MPKISKIGLSHDDIHEEIMKNKYTIQIIQNDIESIKNNHLKHIEDDMDSINKKVDKLDEKIDKKIDKMDGRLWWIIGILIAATLIPMIKDSL